MATNEHADHPTSLAVHIDSPLIGIIFFEEDGEEVTRYFADEADARAAVAEHGRVDVLALAGVWSDLDWDQCIDDLDQIRHGPTAT